MSFNLSIKIGAIWQGAKTFVQAKKDAVKLGSAIDGVGKKKTTIKE